jgi:hypothetical protein
MRCCLIALGNFWLAFAFALIVGCHLARTSPEMYSFAGFGSWVYPETYNFWIGLAFAIAIVNFVLGYVVGRQRV